jgi:hypothetical protein
MAEKKQVFKLPEEKVTIRFIQKPKNGITDKSHVAYGGLLNKAAFTLPARKLDKGHYTNVISKEEKIGLEELMNLEENALSVYRKEDNFWDTVSIRLNKDDQRFDISNPMDFIKVRVLESYDDLIAPSLSEYEKQKKATYRWVIIRENEEHKKLSKAIDVKKNAYIAYGKMEDSKESMEDMLRMYGISPALDSSVEFLRGILGEKLEDDPRKFLELRNDKDYAIKVLLLKGVSNGVVIASGGMYKTDEGVSISPLNVAPTMQSAIAYLNSPEGQEVRLYIEAKLGKTKK